jgi:hypothetical protein
MTKVDSDHVKFMNANGPPFGEPLVVSENDVGSPWPDVICGPSAGEAQPRTLHSDGPANGRRALM